MPAGVGVGWRIGGGPVCWLPVCLHESAPALLGPMYCATWLLSPRVGSGFVNAYFRWLRRPNAWDVAPKSDCIPLSEPASRKRITPFPPNCVHQAPDAERLHQEALLNAINPLKSLSTASSLPRKSRFSATVLLMALSIAGSNMEKSTLNCWYSASIESHSCNPLR